MNLLQLGKKGLNREEIENLLKKGAYHAFMEDDYKTAELGEEDIDAILSKNSTLLQVGDMHL